MRVAVARSGLRTASLRARPRNRCGGHRQNAGIGIGIAEMKLAKPELIARRTYSRLELTFSSSPCRREFRRTRSVTDVCSPDLARSRPLRLGRA